MQSKLEWQHIDAYVFITAKRTHTHTHIHFDSTHTASKNTVQRNSEKLSREEKTRRRLEQMGLHSGPQRRSSDAFPKARCLSELGLQKERDLCKRKEVSAKGKRSLPR